MILTSLCSSNTLVVGTGDKAHQARYQHHLLGFDSVAARAAQSDLSAAQRVQQQQAAMSSALAGLTASLDELPSGNQATAQDARSTDSDASLAGVGAQFGAHSSGLGGAPHAPPV